MIIDKRHVYSIPITGMTRIIKYNQRMLCPYNVGLNVMFSFATINKIKLKEIELKT